MMVVIVVGLLLVDGLVLNDGVVICYDCCCYCHFIIIVIIDVWFFVDWLMG